DALFRLVDSPELEQRKAALTDVGSRRSKLIEQRKRLIKRRDSLREEMLDPDYDDDLYGYKEDVRKLAAAIKKIDDELVLVRPVTPALEWAGNGVGLREEWERGSFDDDEKRELIADALGSIIVHRTTKRGPGFDPSRIRFGVDTEAHCG